MRSEKYYWSWLRLAILELIPHIQLRKVLDIGTADAQNLKNCCDKFEMGIGLDINLNQIVKARENTAMHKNIDYIRGDAEKLPFRRGVFDFIFCTETLEHLTSPSNCIKEIASVLTERGRVIISTPNSLTIPPHPLSEEHKVYLSPMELKALCKTHKLNFEVQKGTSFKFPIVRLGNKLNFFYSIFDNFTATFRNRLKILTQTIAIRFVKERKKS